MLLLIIVVLFFCFSNAQVSHAADISCVVTYDAFSENFAKLKKQGVQVNDLFKQNYPSGRRPTSSTCHDVYTIRKERPVEMD
jgi:hypothetical protein